MRALYLLTVVFVLIDSPTYGQTAAITCPAISEDVPEIHYVTEFGDGFYPNGTHVSFKCVDGSGSLECTDRGEWSGEIPTCGVLSCVVHPVLHDGTITYVNAVGEPAALTSDGNFSLGTYASYECGDGFKLVGHSTFLCLYGGEFRGDYPTCVAEFDCNVLDGLEHLVASSRSEVLNPDEVGTNMQPVSFPVGCNEPCTMDIVIDVNVNRNDLNTDTFSIEVYRAEESEVSFQDLAMYSITDTTCTQLPLKNSVSYNVVLDKFTGVTGTVSISADTKLVAVLQIKHTGDSDFPTEIQLAAYSRWIS